MADLFIRREAIEREEGTGRFEVLSDGDMNSHSEVRAAAQEGRFSLPRKSAGLTGPRKGTWRGHSHSRRRRRSLGAGAC